MTYSQLTKIKALGSILFACMLEMGLAADTGWLQPGVRAWYVGGTGSLGSEDAEMAIMIDRFENGAAYMTRHSSISYWTSPMPAAQVISPDAASEGAFWINPARLAALQPPAVFVWQDLVYVVSRATYTPATLPFLYLLPEEALFALSPSREIITLTYSHDDFTGDYFFDVQTGLLLSQTESLTSGGQVTSTILTLSEINYDFYNRTAFAEDYGLHTAFCGHYSASRSLGFGLGTQAYQLTPAVISRYKNKVLFRHTGIFSDTNWLYPVSFNQYVSYDADLQKVYLSDDGVTWDEIGDHIYMWMPPADRSLKAGLSASHIRVWDIDMDRTATGVFTSPLWPPAVPGFYTLVFDSSGYVSDMCPVWSNLNFWVASWQDASAINRMDGLSYYQNTMTPAEPSSDSVVLFDSSAYSADANSGSVTLAVTRVNSASGSCSVNYATSNGTARAGTDYTAASGTLSWSAGDSAAKTISISLINSGASGKTFGVTLSDALGAVLGYISGATVTITATPSAPSGVTASKGTYTNKVHIAWNSVAGATSYLIFRSRTNTTGSACQINSTAATSCDDTAVTNWPGVTIYYWVKAVNAVGTSDFSASAMGWAGNATVEGDFDGDHYADPYTVINSSWYIWFTGAGYQLCGGPWNFGVAGNRAAGDFDRDGKTDPAMVLNGNWYIWMSSGSYAQQGPFTFSVPGGKPVAADFDGDRYADPAMVANGVWTIWMTSGGYAPQGPFSFSVSGANPYPLAGDFDGDRYADPAMVVNNYWTIWMTSGGYAPQGPFLFNP